MKKSNSIAFRFSELKGSRLRCLLSTHRSRCLVAEFLTSLSYGQAKIDERDNWAPGGFFQPREVKLGETSGFLDDDQRTTLTQWWLSNSVGANTPNWDLVSTAEIEGKRGLLIVEAKAHEGEFADDSCGAKDPANHEQIKKAIQEANAAWNNAVPGFALSTERHYQLSNRFAFAWKLASMKIPVVLVYLGFLYAEEMQGKKVFKSHDDWKNCVVNGAKQIVPKAVWGNRFSFDNTSVSTFIQSAVVNVETTIPEKNQG